jgi:hypothetical protein
VNPADLREEIAVELEAMEITVNELLALARGCCRQRSNHSREYSGCCLFGSVLQWSREYPQTD